MASKNQIKDNLNDILRRELLTWCRCSSEDNGIAVDVYDVSYGTKFLKFLVTSKKSKI